MSDVIQVHAFLPRQLKRRAFSVLAQQERKFTHWLRDALEEWLAEVEQPRESPASVTEARHRVCAYQVTEAEK